MANEGGRLGFVTRCWGVADGSWRTEVRLEEPGRTVSRATRIVARSRVEVSGTVWVMKADDGWLIRG